MSLVITSSKQQQYEGIDGAGVEKPFSYKNHMKSPLIIKKNSEIAVVSVRVDRQSNITIARGDRMGLYWGEETAANDIVGVEPNLVCFLQVPFGTYSLDQFAIALQTEITNLGQETFSNFRTSQVEVETDADDDFAHFKITLSQNASATNVSNTLSSGSFVACIDSRNDKAANIFVEATYGTDFVFTNDFSVSGNAVTAGTDINREAIAILATDYLSSTSGVCEFNFSDAPGNIKVGLVRNMPEDRPAPTTFNTVFFQDPNFADEDGNLLSEFYDYVFTLEREPPATVPSGYSVAQCVVVEDPEKGTQMVKVPSASYTTNVPNASFDTSKGVYFDKVRFTRFGEEIKIEVVDTAGNASTLIDAGTEALKPCGQACDFLYAKMDIGTVSETISIDRFDKGTATSRNYEDPRFYGFNINRTTSEARDAAEIQNDYTNYVNGQGAVAVSTGFSPANLIDDPITATVNASGGQERSWVLVLGPDEQYNTEDVVGEMIPTNTIQTTLGFSKTVLLETGDRDASSKTNDIVFKSDKAPSFDATENMFIRWNATQQQSYNGNQGSISKIIYACPRFDIRGSDTGALYYEPYERVYVDCNNTEDVMISDIGVDIVDVNEILVDNLVGDTQINFHIRQKESFQLGRDSGRT